MAKNGTTSKWDSGCKYDLPLMQIILINEIKISDYKKQQHSQRYLGQTVQSAY